MSQCAYLSVPDPEFAALAAQLPPPGPDSDDIEVLRQDFNTDAIPMAMKNHGPHLPAESEYSVEDRQVPVEGGEILVRCLTPTPTGAGDKAFPLLVWIHGGCWALGNVDFDDYYLRILCVDLQISIVNVEYRLAPEHPFPIGLNDCYAALKWAAVNASTLRASPSLGFLVGGASAGGNLTAACALRARDDPLFSPANGRALTGQVLQIPITIHPEAVPEKYKSELLSMEQNKDAFGLSAADMYKFYRMLRGPPTSPLLSPVLAPTHAGLPPAYVQVCGLDPLRDEGLLYAKLLKDAGVRMRLDVYPGVPHGFHIGFPGITAAVKADKEFREGIRWLLAGDTEL